ncbi:hypothetical protein A2U01_0062251, partial [Trifolium medium]|nr:hypothetical protein [Trifolium medium]
PSLYALPTPALTDDETWVLTVGLVVDREQSGWVEDSMEVDSTEDGKGYETVLDVEFDFDPETYLPEGELNRLPESWNWVAGLELPFVFQS